MAMCDPILNWEDDADIYEMKKIDGMKWMILWGYPTLKVDISEAQKCWHRVLSFFSFSLLLVGQNLKWTKVDFPSH